MPNLSWATAPDELAGYAKANLSVRSASARSGAADGYLTISKGARSGVPSSRFGVGPVTPTPTGGLRLDGWARLLRHDARLDYEGRLGSLGDALNRTGLAWTFVATDPGAAAAAADHEGVVRSATLGGPEEIGRALASGAQAVVAQVKTDGLPAAVRAVGSACVVVASASSPDRNRHLGVLAAAPACGLGRAGLRSPGTHRDGLATLPDVAPTFLETLDVATPTTMSGEPVTAAAGGSVSKLVERDRRTFVADRARTPLTWLFVALHAVGAVVAVRRPRARHAVACTLLAVPAASLLVMLVPWWRWKLAGAVLAGGAIVVVAAVVVVRLTRHDPELGPAVLAGATAAVIALDAAFRSPLQIDGPFGNSPVVAGRFFGVGNIGSGFLVAGTLVACGTALHRRGRGALPLAAIAMVAAVVLDGAPWFGADVGGVLMAVPAFGVLVVVWRRGRVNVRTLVALGVAAALAVVALATADALSSGSGTHVRRVVADDGLADEIARKAGRAVRNVRKPMCLVIVFGAAALAAARPSLAGRGALRATAIGLVVAGVLGSALNDSGLLVGAAVAAVGWPWAIALNRRRDDTPAPAAFASARGS